MPTLTVLLVILLPLCTTLIAALSDQPISRSRTKLGAWPIGVACFGAIITLMIVAVQGPIVIRFYDHTAGLSLPLPLGFYIDRLSAVMMVLISAIGTVIYVYSIDYMSQEPYEGRYLATLGGAVVVLLCMVSSSNLLMLFVFWQILSYLLYLLIHNHPHAVTLESAFRTFNVLRVGDIAFLAGIVLAYQLFGTLEFPDLFEAAARSTATVQVIPGIDMNGSTAVTLLLLIGGMSKSAQFPFHVWLPRYLYAPTPVTALLHAGIINAAGFLINRLAPLFGLSSTTLHVAFIIGTLTAILGASMMLAQNDIKNMLGFSTIGQMGYMMMECGLGAFSLAVFHLIAHGLFKATVFLNCGNVIAKARQEPHFPHPEYEPEADGHSNLTWFTGFVTTLLIPLIILLVTHGVLRIPLLESQGTVIFLFFIWITSSQAILTLMRLRQIASWKVSASMLATLLFIVFIYLFAVESFTAFLYPNPNDVAAYFKAADLPDWLFDLLILGATTLTAFGWTYLYMKAHGLSMPIPRWIDSVRIQFYTLFLNRLFLDEALRRVGRAQLFLLQRWGRRA
ncbi:MAG: proton-conducting transporter membrane subunit [Nitrospira sp.]|nr:proton-conducting transporter membrane subunit [Nitrospira sp.]